MKGREGVDRDRQEERWGVKSTRTEEMKGGRKGHWRSQRDIGPKGALNIRKIYM